MAPTISINPAGSSGELPVLEETRYERVSAGMLAVFATMAVLTVGMLALWFANRRLTFSTRSHADTAPIEFGGDPVPDKFQTPEVQSPADVSDDPSVVDATDQQPAAREVLENVLAHSDRAARQLPQQTGAQSTDAGKLGSSIGGRRPLGPAGPVGKLPKHERWFIAWGTGSVAEYARQLDYFQIELGLIRRTKDGTELVRLQNVSGQARVSIGRKVDADDLWFSWKDAARRRVDLMLFEKAGVDIGRVVEVVHFYPPQAVQLLEAAERGAANRPIRDIRRTYFAVRPGGAGYRFVVTRLTYFER